MNFMHKIGVELEFIRMVDQKSFYIKIQKNS